jgi:hypothetical protein
MVRSGDSSTFSSTRCTALGTQSRCRAVFGACITLHVTGVQAGATRSSASCLPRERRSLSIPSLRALTSRALAAVALATAGLTCSSSTAPPAEPVHSILFIGNSLTYSNDLPEMVRRISAADGRELEVDIVARTNMAVVDHTTGPSDALARIRGGEWDFVVLQQGPTPPGMCRDTLVIAAMRLAPPIRQAGGRPVLWLPWARPTAPQSLDPAAESATLAARAVGGAVVPIGIAWRDALAGDASLPLYGGDGYHPAPAGSLLAALTIYDRLSGRDVRTLSPGLLRPIGPSTLSTAGIQALASAAHKASAAWPSDPMEPAPADTTHVSSTGGPC